MPSTLSGCSPEHALGQQLADQAIKRYHETRHGTATLICHSENLTYRVDTPQARFALRLQRPGNHGHDAITSEMAWLTALADDGFPVAHPCRGRDGAWVQRLSDTHDAVLFTWLEGNHPAPDAHLPQTMSMIGALTARLHLHSQQWQRPEDFIRPCWTPDTMTAPQGLWGDWRAARLSAAQHPVIEAALSRVSAQLTDYGRTTQRFGLIHADLRLGNLLVDGPHLHLIDFDDCGEGWWLHDLAATLSFHEHHAELPRWIEHWCAGYTRYRPLDQHDLSVLPSLIVQRRIQLLAWCARHAGNDTVSTLPADWGEQTVTLCRRYLANAL